MSLTTASLKTQPASSNTTILLNSNLPEAPSISAKTTVTLTNEALTKFQARMADLASLIDSYNRDSNETTKAACDKALSTALADLPAESRENAMQHTPPPGIFLL